VTAAAGSSACGFGTIAGMHIPSSDRPRAVLAKAAVVAALIALAGCSQEDDSNTAADVPSATEEALAPAAELAAPAFSATLRRGDLMPLVFPGWEDKDKGRVGTVTLPDIGNDGKPVPDSEGEQQADVSPREVVRLDDTHAVMLTETVPLDDQGQPMDAHVAGAWIGAYFFEQGNDGWALSKRNDAVGYQGFMGSIGKTAVERIAPQRFVLTATSGSCWQGYCGSWLSVYELGASEVREMVSGIPMSASNGGADGACEQVLANERPETPPRGSCFEVEGSAQFALGTDDEPGEMRLVFSGTRTSGAGARAESVDSTVVYAYRKGSYVPGSGRNPVPSF